MKANLAEEVMNYVLGKDSKVHQSPISYCTLDHDTVHNLADLNLSIFLITSGIVFLIVNALYKNTYDRTTYEMINWTWNAEIITAILLYHINIGLVVCILMWPIMQNV